MSQKHTPLPWNNDNYHGKTNVVDSSSRLVCNTGGYSDNYTQNLIEINEANAALIVHAVNNSHKIALVDELVTAAGEAAETFRRYASLHRAKPDHVKADANDAMAEMLERVILKAKGAAS